MPYARGPALKGIGEVANELQADLLQFYNTGTQVRVCSPLARNIPEGCEILSVRARFYQYVSLNGQRITPVTRTLRNSAGSSIVRASINGRTFAGEVLSIFDHLQTGLPSSHLFAHVRWMKDIEDSPLDEDVWSPL